MGGDRFDFIVKTLIEHAPRREAIKALAGGALAAVATRLNVDQTGANKKKKRRRRRKKKKNRRQTCVERRQTCDGSRRCCGKVTACREFPTTTCTTLSGRFCCGLEGAVCSNDPAINDCDCCDGLYCGGAPGQAGRCQEEPV